MEQDLGLFRDPPMCPLFSGKRFWGLGDFRLRALRLGVCWALGLLTGLCGGRRPLPPGPNAFLETGVQIALGSPAVHGAPGWPAWPLLSPRAGFARRPPCGLVVPLFACSSRLGAQGEALPPNF